MSQGPFTITKGTPAIDTVVFSVVVPVYNGSRTIRDCIQAVLDQHFPPHLYELIVVDNGSRDNTQQIVREYPRVKLLQATSVQSSYAARNVGIEHASGEIVAFTDADCVPDPDWLEKLSVQFQDPKVLAVGGKVVDSPARNLVEAFLGEVSPLSTYQEAPGQFLKPVITANAAFRRKFLVDLGCFNDRLYTGADIDLGWRLQTKYGDSVRYTSEAVIYHHHRSNLKSMFRQYRRHGFGEILLDAMYRQQPGYPRTLRYQAKQIVRQWIALLKNLRSFFYQLLLYPARRDRYGLAKPIFWMIAEGGNLWGKLQGLWATRGMRLNPAARQWQDPGG